MNIPDYVKIGGHNYKITQCSPDTMVTNAGDIDHKYNSIRLDKTLCDDQKLETLLHEITHAISHIYELDLNHNQVSVLSAVLHQVIKDNKTIFIT